MPPSIFLQGNDWDAAQADLWSQDARGAVADQWVQHAQDALNNHPLLNGGALSPGAALAEGADNAAGATLDAPSSPVSGAGAGPPTPAAAPAPPPPANPNPTGFVQTQGLPPPPAPQSPAPNAPTNITPDAVHEQYIRQAAAARGIDPDTAVRVWSGEGRNNYTGDNGSSFGDFQLHYGGVAPGGNAVGGLGDAFTKATGLDARDPSTWQQQDDFALDQVKNGGWTPFHGAAAQGIGAQQGIGVPVASTQQTAAPQDPEQWKQLALQQLNKPYIWGSGSGAGGRGSQDVDPNTGLPNGFDCSGYVSWVLKNGMGVDIPAQVQTAYKSGKLTPVQGDPQPGDVVFYDPTNPDPTQQHMALYLGNGQIIEAGGTKNNVNIAPVNAGGQPIFMRPGGSSQTLQDHVANTVSSAAQAVQQGASAVGQGAQNLTQFLTGLGREPTDQELSGFLADHPNQTTPGFGYDPSHIPLSNGTPPPPDNTGPLQLNPAIGQTVQDIAGGKYSLLNNAAENVDLANKYPSSVPGLPDFASMSPEDYQRYGANTEAVGGLEASPGAEFDQYGVEKGFVPPNAKNPPPPTPEPWTPDNGLEPEVAATLPQGPTQDDLMRNFIAQAKANGVDTSAVERQYGITPPQPPLAQAAESQIPSGGAGLPPNEFLPTGAMPGQLSLGFGDENTAIPFGGARPTGTESLPGGPQQGQLSFDSPVPVGGPRPVGNEASGPVGYQRGQTTALPGFQLPTTPVSPLDLLNRYHSGNVVSGLPTLAHVAANAVIAPVWSATTHGAADLATLRVDRLAGRSVGQWAALTNIGSDFMDGLRQALGNPESVANRVDNPALKFFLQAQTAAGGGLHSAFQNIAQNAVQRMELGAAAGEQAAREGLRPGSGFGQRVGELINDPSQLGNAAALPKDIAQRAALRAQGGNLQQAMQAIANVPVIGNTLFPVVRISSQALAQGLERSPLGFIGTAADVGAGLLKQGPYAKGFNVPGGAVSPLQERVLNNVAGTALSAFFVSKALDGTLTGNGPTDPGQRALLTSRGWQPNSIYVPGLGYRDTHFFGPLAQPLAQAAALGDAVLYGGKDATLINQAGVAAQSLGHYLEGTTGLQTISEIAQLMQGGAGTDKLAARFIGNTASGFIPESGLVRSAAIGGDLGPARSPELRTEPGQDWVQGLLSGVGQTVQQNIPGLRANVPTSQDVLGRTMSNANAGLGVLLPRGGGGSPSPILQAFLAAGQTIPTAPANVTIGNVPIPLTNDEQRQYIQQRGEILTQMAAKVIADPRFQSAPPEQQRFILGKILDAADQVARQQMLPGLIDRRPAAQTQATAKHAPLSLPVPLR